MGFTALNSSTQKRYLPKIDAQKGLTDTQRLWIQEKATWVANALATPEGKQAVQNLWNHLDKVLQCPRALEDWCAPVFNLMLSSLPFSEPPTLKGRGGIYSPVAIGAYYREHKESHFSQKGFYAWLYEMLLEESRCIGNKVEDQDFQENYIPQHQKPYILDIILTKGFAHEICHIIQHEGRIAIEEDNAEMKAFFGDMINRISSYTNALKAAKDVDKYYVFASLAQSYNGHSYPYENQPVEEDALLFESVFKDHFANNVLENDDVIETLWENIELKKDINRFPDASIFM